jgi:hypothetical protein
LKTSESTSTQDSEISPETAETKKPGDAESSLRALARQFTLDEKPETADGEQHEGKPSESSRKGKAKPKTFNELAERLELDVKDLYDVEIPAAKPGEKYTLGQLKDHLAERENFTVSQLKLDEDRARLESDFTRAQQELQTLLAELPKADVKPETIEKIRQRAAATLKTERAKTLEVIPEWREEERRKQEIEGIVEHLTGYGLPASYLQTVSDHRVMKYLRDNFLRKQRLDKALALVGEKKPNALGKGKPATDKKGAQQPTQRLTREEQQVQRYLRAVNSQGD